VWKGWRFLKSPSLPHRLRAKEKVADGLITTSYFLNG
jgi:hypothetical protein